MKYFIFTLGCQMNVSDSQRIAGVLDSLGLKSAPEEEADLIIVNACSVRQSAVDRIYGKLKKWQDKKVIISGCLLPADKEKLKKRVELIFNIKDLPQLPKYLSDILGKKFDYPKKSLNKDYFTLAPSLGKGESEAFVPIMTGCDHFCSYCAVPYTRGREYSRKEEEIINEVSCLIKKGFKKIVLLGQNVNRYGLSGKKGGLKIKNPPFVKLLKKLIKIPGQFEIKFISPNPWDFPDELIDLIAKEPKLSKEIHLPVQSGDDKILRKMNRPYTAQQYIELVNKLKTKINGLKLSTDIIVGFPGETKKAFENTLKLCKKANFDKAYIAMYSPRPGTSAFRLEDDVPKEEKKRRWQILEEMINKKN